MQMSVDRRPSRMLWWLRAAIVVGMLFVTTGVGGMVYQARQKVAAIDCLSGASPPSDWEFDQGGSERLRSILGQRGSLMLLDSPRELCFYDVLTEDRVQALTDLPTLRRLYISDVPPELVVRLQKLTNLEHLAFHGEVPPEEIADLHGSLPDCDIIYRRHGNHPIVYFRPATRSEFDR
jgi:hypothetical protein